jgi:diacylglycerol kinase (ATP)
MLVPDPSSPSSSELAPVPDVSHVHRKGRRLRAGAWKVAGDLPASFRYAAQGLAYAIASQRNFRIHVITGAVVFALGRAVRDTLEDCEKDKAADALQKRQHNKPDNL